MALTPRGFGVDEEIGAGQLVLEEAVDLRANRRRRRRAARGEVLDGVELEARVTPPDDPYSRVLLDVEEEQLDRLFVPADLDPDLDVEEPALLVEGADLVRQVRGRAIRLGVQPQRGGEHVGVVVLVTVEARQEQRAGVDANAQRDVPSPFR